MVAPDGNQGKFFGLDVSVERMNDTTTTVHVAGELDLSTSRQLEGDLQQLIDDGGCRRLVLDLSRLSFLDSTGLRALWGTRQHAQAAGAVLLLESPSEPVMRVLKVTKLDKVFQVVDHESVDID